MRLQFIARLSLAVVSSFFICAAALARPPFGGPPGPPGPPGPEGWIEEHADQLGLDDETREKIRDIVDESHEYAAVLHRTHREARRALRDLLSQDSPDEASVMQQAELLGEIETKMSKHRLRTLLRIHALLTPEQRKEMMAIHRGRHGGPEMLLESCEDDLEKLCPGAESPFDHMGCLHEHADAVSEGCASAMDRLRDKWESRRGHFRR